MTVQLSIETTNNNIQLTLDVEHFEIEDWVYKNYEQQNTQTTNKIQLGSENRTCPDFEWPTFVQFSNSWDYRYNYAPDHLKSGPFKYQPSKSPEFKWSVFGSPLYIIKEQLFYKFNLTFVSI